MLTQKNRINPVRLWEFLSRIYTNRNIAVVQIFWGKEEEILIVGTKDEITNNKMFRRKWKCLFVVDFYIDKPTPTIIVEGDD